jgi:hypothetical protein
MTYQGWSADQFRVIELITHVDLVKFLIDIGLTGHQITIFFYVYGITIFIAIFLKWFFQDTD